MQAIRSGDYETMPKFKGEVKVRLIEEMKYREKLRKRLGAQRKQDWDFIIQGADAGNIIVYLTRSRGHRSFFELKDRLAELTAQRDRKIKGFLSMTRPK